MQCNSMQSLHARLTGRILSPFYIYIYIYIYIERERERERERYAV